MGDSNGMYGDKGDKNDVEIEDSGGVWTMSCLFDRTLLSHATYSLVLGGFSRSASSF